MAAGSMAYQASAGSAAIGARFQTLAGCDSAIMMSDQITEGKIGMTSGDRVPDAVVETFSCDINDGSDMDDWDSAVKFYQDQVGKIKSAALSQNQAYQWTPFRGGTVGDLAGTVLDLAEAGLARRARFDPKGLDETHYLAPLRETVVTGRTPAEVALAAFAGAWGGSLEPLFRECAY